MLVKRAARNGSKDEVKCPVTQERVFGGVCAQEVVEVTTPHPWSKMMKDGASWLEEKKSPRVSQ